MSAHPHPDDTIVALASAAGIGARAIIRLSGSKVSEVIASIFAEVPQPWPARRFFRIGEIRLPDLHSPIPADLYYNPAPKTYTGQDTAELHTTACAPLVDATIAALLNLGVRAAQPGEFTLRAFLAGKKDLPQSEAVLAVIEAGSNDELQLALGQLAGGVTQPLQGLREDLLNLLADVEAGLDFSEEDIQFVGKKDVLLRIGKGMAQLINLQRQLQDRSVSGRAFRVALIGEPNAGKSSLFNALIGDAAAIVSPVPGTTRDYITRTLHLDSLAVELIDTAGHQDAANTIEQQAQQLGKEQAKLADLLLWCVSIDEAIAAVPAELDGVPVVIARTKCDRGLAQAGFSTSSVTGEGIDELRKELRQRAVDFHRQPLAPSISRCRHHVDSCLGHLRKAHSIVLFDDPAELFALELRLALDHLGEMIGEVYTDDLLDRIFSRFCIGK
jgi:tRNA modification GTPase